MLFSSISFLYYFLPWVLILYYLLPWQFKNAILLATSLFFYAWGGLTYTWLMLVVIAMGFIWGLLLERYQGTRAAKWILAAAMVSNVATLVYYKFAEVFPIGISFYTFQVMSYIVDVYRGQVPAQRNLVNFGAYASMFPQLVAGPIVRYADVNQQLESRSHRFAYAAAGIRRFVIGLAKKILIANTLGELCDIFRASGDKSVLFFWMYAVAFTLHIYFDFSGYSDMAVGLGKLFGFEFMDNFNYPYISRSVTEFWRRWHISLGSWFRDYVYIPLGGNRVSKGRWYVNIFIVWFLTGFWHGAAWNFIIWGLGYAVLLVIEKAGLLTWLEQKKTVSHFYTLLVVIVGFVIFNAVDMRQAVGDIRGMFGLGGVPAVSAEALYYLRSYLVIFAVAIVGATPIPKLAVDKLSKTAGAAAGSTGTMVSVSGMIVEAAALIGLWLLVTAYLVDGSFNPFLYFRF